MARAELNEYDSIINNIQDGYFETDLAGSFTYANVAACEICGYPKDEIIGLNYRQYTDATNGKKAFSAFNKIYKSGDAGKLINYEIVRKDGTRRQVEISASLILDRSGKPVGFRGTTRDITNRRQMEENLQRSEERYRTIIDNIEDAYFEVDLKGKFTFVNDALCESLGYFWDELIGMDHRHYAEESTVRELFALFNRVYRTGAPVKAYSFELSRKDGRKGFCEISVTLIRDKQGKPVGFRGIARDVTERKQFEEQIRHLATHDTLTGLINSFMFRELLQENIDYAHRYGKRFALFFMDLDGFKIINDTLGHEAGDQVLVECAARLRRTLRASDCIARLGGDEFVMLLRDVSRLEEVTLLADKILSTIREPVDLGGSEYVVTGSMGISIYPQDGEDVHTLMKTADLAMYSAKEKGKDNFQIFSPEVKPLLHEKSLFGELLRFALERNELFLEYQPRLNLKTGAISGVEALLRWRNPTLGSVAPLQFIPVAESTGQIIPIGRWVLQKACLQNVAWQRQGLARVSISVNISQRQLLDEQLIGDIEDALAESGLDPELLELEIAERTILSNLPRIIDVLKGIKDIGVQLVVDDFGSGYSSLSQIRYFPIDSFKVDRSLISGAPANEISKVVIRAIFEIGKLLDLTVVSEGVETPEQLAFVRASSCDLMQGFYFSKPVSPDEIAALLREHVPRPL
ncbi:MAG: EAL domain-containing protein [Firmicutes bacterium]|nr:EAL domain-containing protein [Bacillota bacterium]